MRPIGEGGPAPDRQPRAPAPPSGQLSARAPAWRTARAPARRGGTTTPRRTRRPGDARRPAARELLIERGLAVTLNDIAHHASCGVGTVYRRFPDKEPLIDALFEERVSEMVALAEEALSNPDPWDGLARFLEHGNDLQARDRGLKELLLSTDQGSARVTAARERLEPIVGQLVTRAQAAGALRADIRVQDIPVIQIMLGAVIDASREIEPELWRRYLALMVRGLCGGARPRQDLDRSATRGVQEARQGCRQRDIGPERDVRS
jgi:AcrR family transcriptional regulator